MSIICRRASSSLTSNTSTVTALTPTITLLRSATSEIYLIGTAHISKKSVEEVRDTIQLVKPDKVFLELCEGRARAMRRGDETSAASSTDFQHLKSMASSAMAMMSMGGSVQSAMGSFQGINPDSIFKMMGFQPGKEFRVAMAEADLIDAKIINGDIDVNVTLAGVKSSLPQINLLLATATPMPQVLQTMIQKTMKSGGNVSNSLNPESLKTREHASSIRKYVSTAVPPIAEVILHNRDRYMASQLKQHCNNGKVVAVVGIAHLEGLIIEWEKLN